MLRKCWRSEEIEHRLIPNYGRGDVPVGMGRTRHLLASSVQAEQPLVVGFGK